MTLDHVARSLSRLGWTGTLKVAASRRLPARLFRGRTMTLRPRGHAYPFHFRHGTTDLTAVIDVLLLDEYACTLNVPNVRVIVDAGANIGTTSTYLLAAYPTATVVALEPDPANFAILVRNLARYGSRARCVQAALWDQPTRLTLDRRGGEWSTRVRAARPDEGDVRGTSVSHLLEECGLTHIDILKMDIEGAEQVVFRADANNWLDRVRVIAIDLHGRDCEAAFSAATACHAAETTRHRLVTRWSRA
jgi:FkbM family methyltransferase